MTCPRKRPSPRPLTLPAPLPRLMRDDDDRARLVVGSEHGVAGWSPMRPLHVVVHPGDAVEHPSGWEDKSLYASVVAGSLQRQAAMAAEIFVRMASHDMVVLHRRSSIEFHRPSAWVDENYRQAVVMATRNPRCAWLYGDDLPSMLDWLIDRAQVTARPAVFFTGAYSDDQFGCITFLGQGIEQRAPGVTVRVSDHAPSDANDSSPHWVPSNANRPLGLKIR